MILSSVHWNRYSINEICNYNYIVVDFYVPTFIQSKAVILAHCVWANHSC
jgi:hypothetical protein